VLQQLPVGPFQKVASRALWSACKDFKGKGKGKGWAKGKGKGKGLFGCFWPAESSSSAEDSGDNEGKAADGEEPHNPPNLDAVQASMAQAFLPVLASAAGTEAGRAKLNHAGSKRREALLPFVTRVGELLDFVPETASLQPSAQAYIDGSDTEHLGDFVAELLKAWSTAASPDAVLQVLQLLPVGPFQKVASRVLWSACKDFKGKGKGKGWAKGKGKGKGLFGCFWPAESSSSAEDSGDNDGTEATPAGAPTKDPAGQDAGTDMPTMRDEEDWSVV